METKCLIVDDEPPARELIKSYLERLTGYTICGSFGNSQEAFHYLNTNQVDLLFVDIDMPQMNGLELIKGLVQRPRTVITTAYREYAADGFDLNILDYLVKPVSFERFLQSISRYNHSLALNMNTTHSLDDAYMFFKVERDMVKIYLKDILFIESLQDYIKIVTSEKTYITYTRIGFMEDKLPEAHFVRIHKSYIIAIASVESFRHDGVSLAGVQLPIGRVFKQNFMDALEKHRSK